MSLTIKQAFEALSDACSAGMKNPFFVMRRLKDSFADVASKVVDASGDKVTVTPITDSGTKIAEIKVNNTTSNLYAPGAMHNYSTTEQIVGKWTDGSDVYEKIIEATTSNTDEDQTINVASLNIKDVIEMNAIAKSSNGSVQLNYEVPTVGGTIEFFNVYFADNNASLKLAHYASWARQIPIKIVLRYTKNAT